MQWLINYGLSSEKMVGNSTGRLISQGFEPGVRRVEDGHLVTSVNTDASERGRAGWDGGPWEVHGQ